MKKKNLGSAEVKFSQLDPQSYERLKNNLILAEKAHNSIMDEIRQVRSNEKNPTIDDPSTYLGELKQKEASKAKEISELQSLLTYCKIVEEKTFEDIVCINDTINLTYFHDDGEIEPEQIFKLVGISPDHEKGEISKDSPVGAGVLGKKIGDKVLVKLPEEHWMEVLIVSKE